MATASTSPHVVENLQLRDAVLQPQRDVRRDWFRRILAADVAGVCAAIALIAGVLSWRSSALLPAAWTLALILLVPVIARARGTYSWRMHLDVIEGFSVPFVEVGLAWLVVASSWSLLSPATFRSRLLLLACATVAVTVSIARGVVFTQEAASRRRGQSLRPTLIVGAGRVGNLIGRRLLQHPEFGLRPVGYLDDAPLELSGDHRPLPVIGGTAGLDAAIAEHAIEHVVITFSLASHEELVAVAERAAALGVEVAMVPRLYEKTSRHVALGRIGGLPVLDMRIVHLESSRYFRIKYAVDRLVASIVLLFVWPIFLLTSLAIWSTMGRPIFFRQVRVGLNGRHFSMLKFRTMASDPAAEVAKELPPDTAPGGVEGGADRRTGLGRLLRQLSIDELPQLINVLNGDMSLIGPRPERPQYVDDFTSTVDGYARRHRVKGGITGWAQASGLRGQTSISERAEWDNYYIENVSFLLDMKIVLLTIGALLHGLVPSSSAPE